jgi:putative tryptophan/tyrosine transport system substrate-binding protein
LIDRRTFLVGTGAVLLAAPLAAEAQQAGKIPKIGYLSGFSPEYDNTWFAAFRQGLQDIGYIEGKTILIEERHVSAGPDEKLPELAAQLIRLKVDLLVVAGTPAARAAKAMTNVIPIVMTNAADPVGTGLVASLARPGGNITGLSDFNTGVVAKRLELLKEVIPSAIRVAALLNPANPTNPPQIALTQAAASALGVTILSFEAERANEIARAFVTMKRERSTGLIVIGDPRPRRSQKANSGACGQEPAAGRLQPEPMGECRRADVLRDEFLGSLSSSSYVRGQDFERREAGRPTCRATDKVRAGHQPQDRQGARPDDSAVAAGAGG